MKTASLVLGLTLVVTGAMSGVPELLMNGPSVIDVAGTIGCAAGFVLLALSAWLFLRRRRRRRQLLAVALAAVAVQWLVVPAVDAGLVTHAPRTSSPPAGALGIPGARDVTFRAPDGVTISAWMVPGKAPAAVVLLHGSHGTRADLVLHLRFLHRVGFAALALDSRGHGVSGGRTNALGWGAEEDVAGAVDYLRREGFTAVAVLGLSMGAEVALRAAADGVRLDAVVADGAGASTRGDAELVSRGALAPIADSVSWLTMRGVEALSGMREPRPLRDVVHRIRVPVLLISSNRHGEKEIDGAYRAHMSAPATQWYVPDAGHTQALAVHPAEYAARVVSFLRTSLSVR